MKIAFNPSNSNKNILELIKNNKDIIFDLKGHNIYSRGVEFKGTDTNTWRDIKINNVSIGSNTLDLRDSDNTTLTNINGVVTINSTWRPVVDNLTSDSTTSSLSANLGRVLKALIDGKSDSDHNHDGRYLRLDGSDTMKGNLNLCSIGTSYIGKGLGDKSGADFTEANIVIRSWWGISFKSYDNIVRTYIDTRTGNIGTKGVLNAVGAVILGRLYNRGDDEGLLIKKSSNGWAGLILGSTDSDRSCFYLGSNSASWKYVKDGIDTWIQHPYKNGTIALISDIPTKVSQFTNDSGYITSSGSCSYATLSNLTNLLAMNTVPNKTISTSVGGWSPISGRYVFHQKWTDTSTGNDSADFGIYLDGNLTANMVLDGYYNSLLGFRVIGATGGFLKANGTIDNSTYLTSHLSLSNYYTKSEVDTKLNSKLNYRLFWERKNIDLNSITEAWHTYELNNRTYTTNTPTNASWHLAVLWGTGDINYAVLLCTAYTSNYSLYLRHKIAGKWYNWIQLAATTDIPSSLKNPYALTISLNGTSQGPYDGSAAKNINITPGSIGAATSGHNHDGRYVYNYGGTQMDGASINKNALGMTTNSGITEDWWHILQAAWNDEYRWNSLIAFPTLNRNGMYYRSGLDDNTAWGSWIKLLDVGNSYVTEGKGVINGTTITQVDNATNADTVDGYHANSGSNSTPYGRIPVIESDGVMKVGEYIDFHYDNSGKYDFSTRLQASGNYVNWVNLPSASGTLALTSEIPTALPANGGNADTVDGYHSSSFLTKHTREGAYNIDHLTDFVTRDLQPSHEINIEGTKPYDGWGIVTVLKTDNGTAQLVFDGSNNLYFRSSYGSENRYVTSAWKKVIHSGNYTEFINNYYWANVKISTSANTQTQPSVNTIYANNWFRSQGTSGWYNESYGGGIWMNDSTWIRTYGGKSFYCDNLIYSYSTIRTAAQNQAIILSNDASPAWISALNGQVIFNTGNAIRFGETDWDWNQWAGLKYDHSSKTIYLGIADGSVFNANPALSGGSLRFPGISNVYATTFNGSLSGNASTATTADSAHKLNKWFDSRIADLNHLFGDGALRIFHATSSVTDTTKCPSDAAVLHLAWDNNEGLDSLLAIGPRHNTLYFRGLNNYKWNPWQTVLHDGNSSISGNTIKINNTSLTVASSNHNHDNVYLKLAGGTMLDLSRISVNGDLYIGNIDNRGWLYFQDIASLDGAEYWSISTDGSAVFEDISTRSDVNVGGLICRDGISSSWNKGRDNALLRDTSSNGYHPLWSLKTTNGSWDFGEYNQTGWNNIPVLSYITDSNYNSGNNTPTYQIKFPLASGTVALTSNIPNPTNYYWADVKVSSFPSKTTFPTFLNLATTNKILRRHRNLFFTLPFFAAYGLINLSTLTFEGNVTCTVTKITNNHFKISFDILDDIYRYLIFLTPIYGSGYVEVKYYNSDGRTLDYDLYPSSTSINTVNVMLINFRDYVK